MNEVQSRTIGQRVVLIGGVFFAGLVAMLLAGWFISPRWVDICTAFRPDGRPCSPVTTVRAAGVATFFYGTFVLIFGPIITSLYRLFRYGQAWETSRVEPSFVNIPIALGLVYLAVGTGIAYLG